MYLFITGASILKCFDNILRQVVQKFKTQSKSKMLSKLVLYFCLIDNNMKHFYIETPVPY